MSDAELGIKDYNRINQAGTKHNDAITDHETVGDDFSRFLITNC